MKLFGTDGARGEAGKDITAFVAMKLAMAAGIYFKKNLKNRSNIILVGKDTRRSGYMVETAIVAGLTAVGYTVRQVGPMPTPAIAFLTEDMRCDAGIMISASHNIYSDNGIKFFNHFGFKLDEKVEREIEKIYDNEALIMAHQKRNMEIGSAKRIDDVIGRYIVHIKRSFPAHLSLQNFRIVLDVANGASYKVAPTIFKELGAEIIVINDEPNGRNINDNCGALHPENLAKEVKKLRADIGFAFDGDADRLVVVNEKGEVIHGDLLIGALAFYLKKTDNLQNNAIVATIMSNSALDDFLAKNDIKIFRSNVGDKLVFEKMKEIGSNFGAEQSGHVIFSDYAKTGDGITTALQFVAAMSFFGKKASDLGKVFELYPQVLKNLKINEKKALNKIKGLKELENDLHSKGIRTLFRYSGTENLIRLLLEGKDEILLKEEMEKVISFFKKEL